MSKKERRKKWRNAGLSFLALASAFLTGNITSSEQETSVSLETDNVECSCTLRFGQVYELEDGSSLRLSEAASGIATVVIEP